MTGGSTPSSPPASAPSGAERTRPARARALFRARASRDGEGAARVEANARLTAMTAVVLLLLVVAELATVVLGARGHLSLHVIVGLILVPPVLLKIGTTTWRMVSYYRGDAAYLEKGPPPLALRILAPFLVALTFLVLGSGIGLVVVPHSLHSSLLIVHKASFYLWLATFLIHAVAHFKQMIRVAGRDVVARTRVLSAGVRSRRLVLGGSVLLGGALALLLAHRAEVYLRIYPHK
jgi:hypothetical protein